MTTEELIQQVDGWLKQNRPEYHDNLRPGAHPEALAAIEKQFNVQLNEPFKALYRWHDGQDRDCFDAILFNMTFMPLELVIEYKQMLDGMIGTEFDDPDWWRREWVPFLENGGGDFLCLDLGGFKTGNIGQLLWHDHEEAEREIIHPDIDDFLSDLYQRMVNGNLNLSD